MYTMDKKQDIWNNNRRLDVINIIVQKLLLKYQDKVPDHLKFGLQIICVICVHHNDFLEANIDKIAEFLDKEDWSVIDSQTK